MNHALLGIHHVTAIAGDPQKNLDFFTQVLGMRFVKLTVNFDDPGAYHFYFGDRLGRPGTALTYFPHPGGYRGIPGSGQVVAVGLAIPVGTLDRWVTRLADLVVDFDLPEPRFGDRLVGLKDPDGLAIELVESSDAAFGEPWEGSPVGGDMAIRGIHSVTVAANRLEANDRFYVGTMGFVKEAGEGDRTRFRVGNGLASVVDVVPALERGRVALGSVHHVAFRTLDDASQAHWLATARNFGLHASPVMERDYFRSIYFREPNGVLFEIATEGPGFTIDEPEDALGTSLRLPAQYEPMRAAIERRLPPLRLPSREVQR